MLRSNTVNTLRDLAAQGHSIREIGRETGLARNTVRKYLRIAPEAGPRPKRASKLDPFKDQIRRWVRQDHLYNCVTICERLKQLGYTGSITIVKDFVHGMRPPKAGHYPVRRYETRPGEQMQFDWGEFFYLHEGRRRKLFGFTAVLSYSRMRFVHFCKRCDTASLISSLMRAFEYFGGLPEAMLTDRMKSVLLEMDDGKPTWNPRFADFAASIGVVPRVCRAYTPQTKGKVERSIGVVKQSFWPGVAFPDVVDLNRQARSWCDHRNREVHRTTHERPVDRQQAEGLRSLPEGYAWERFRTEERQVSWDGYISYDGVLYGLPSPVPVCGSRVEVSLVRDELVIWRAGQELARHVVRPQSGSIVMHPDQFATVASAYEARQKPAPLGHQVEAPQVARRPLGDYDLLFSVEGLP